MSRFHPSQSYHLENYKVNLSECGKHLDPKTEYILFQKGNKCSSVVQDIIHEGENIEVAFPKELQLYQEADNSSLLSNQILERKLLKFFRKRISTYKNKLYARISRKFPWIEIDGNLRYVMYIVARLYLAKTADEILFRGRCTLFQKEDRKKLLDFYFALLNTDVEHKFTPSQLTFERLTLSRKKIDISKIRKNELLRNSNELESIFVDKLFLL